MANLGGTFPDKPVSVTMCVNFIREQLEPLLLEEEQQRNDIDRLGDTQAPLDERIP